MKTIKEIDEEILKLKEQRKNIVEENKTISKVLEWTKDCDATILIHTLYDYDNAPKYRIFPVGVIPNYAKGNITIMGNSTSFIESLILGKSYINGEPPHKLNFYTNSEELLIKFLNKYKFRSLNFDKKLLEVLKVAEKVSKI